MQFVRWNGSLQFDVNYTLAKGTDTAPLGGGTLSVQGDAARLDPFNLLRDKGPNSRHPPHIQRKRGRVVELPDRQRAASHHQQQPGVVAGAGQQRHTGANRGQHGPQQDGTNSDWPVGVTRSSITLPGRKNVDARISRFINFGGRYKFEIQAEFKNIFDWEQVSGVQTIYAVNATTDVPTVSLPISATR